MSREALQPVPCSIVESYAGMMETVDRAAQSGRAIAFD
jgi:hypothetical protein